MPGRSPAAETRPAHPESPGGPDGGEPEFPVSGARHAGTRSFRFPVADGDYRTPRCDADAIRAEAPPGANGFRVVEALPVWEEDRPTIHVVKVEYYRIEGATDGECRPWPSSGGNSISCCRSRDPRIPVMTRVFHAKKGPTGGP